MIRKLIEYLICITMCNACLFFKEIRQNEVKIEEFNNYINEECINYEINEELTVVFDYEKINYYLENNISESYIETNNGKEFVLYIKINKGIFYKEIKEKYTIRKGDLYDGWN